MVEYNCVHCGRCFVNKSHYDYHNRRYISSKPYIITNVEVVKNKKKGIEKINGKETGNGKKKGMSNDNSHLEGSILKELNILIKSRGSQCSVSGKNYEKKIYNIVKNCTINGIPFNTQKEEELAGSSSKNDIECNFIVENDIGIEVKKYTTPDWMQCSIKYDKNTNSWQPTKKSKNPPECSVIFMELINNLNIYTDDIPPFMKESITHEEWVKSKAESCKWNDIYIDIPSDTIAKLYQSKGCKYIQISNGYGLYHLGNDICGFGVPLFNIEQQLRIRTKIHKRSTKKGFCSISVTIACQPKNIRTLTPSNYTLDNKDNIPPILLYTII